MSRVATAGLAAGPNEPRVAGVGRQLYAAAMALGARAAKLRTQVRQIDGLPVTFYDGGPRNAPAIVMLHGYTADRNVWARFAGHFTRDYRVIVPDLAGHGDTPFDAARSHSGPAQAQLVAQLLTALEIDAAHVIGNSMGGFITAHLGRSHPTRVRSIALVDPGGITSPEQCTLDRLLAAGENPFLIDDPAAFERFYALTMAKPPLNPPIVRRALAANYIARRAELERIWDDFQWNDRFEPATLEPITAPALILWGALDEILDVSAADLWQRGLTGSTLVRFDDLGHMPMLEAPRRAAGIYRQFLEGAATTQAHAPSHPSKQTEQAA